MNGRNVQATGRLFAASSTPARLHDAALIRIGENAMTDVFRRAVTKATGAIGAIARQLTPDKMKAPAEF
jgi:hypothetical protein